MIEQHTTYRAYGICARQDAWFEFRVSGDQHATWAALSMALVSEDGTVETGPSVYLAYNQDSSLEEALILRQSCAVANGLLPKKISEDFVYDLFVYCRKHDDALEAWILKHASDYYRGIVG